MVTAGMAHLCEVVVLATGTETELGRRETWMRWTGVRGEEVGLERYHAGRGEEEGRVVGGKERGGGEDEMVMAVEEGEVGGAEVGGGLDWIASGGGGGGDWIRCSAVVGGVERAAGGVVMAAAAVLSEETTYAVDAVVQRPSSPAERV